MLHPIQEKLLELSKKHNLAKLSLRQMGELIEMKEGSPQKIKHHLLQLEKKGFLKIDKVAGVMDRTSLTPAWAAGLLNKTSKLFSIPVIGTANCGPATIFAEQNFRGFLRLSSKLVGRTRPDGLFAIVADGSSMNKAEIRGKSIEDGDYIIVDSHDKDVKNNEIVLVIIDGSATVKKIINDKENNQIVLRSESTFDYEPIYLHPKDNFSINGKIIDVIKRPKYN